VKAERDGRAKTGVADKQRANLSDGAIGTAGGRISRFVILHLQIGLEVLSEANG